METTSPKKDITYHIEYGLKTVYENPILCMPYLLDIITLTITSIILGGLVFGVASISNYSPIPTALSVFSVGLIFLAALIVISAFFNGVAINLLSKVERKEEVSFSDCFKLDKTRFLNLLVTYIVCGIFGLVLSFSFGVFDAIFSSSVSIIFIATISCVFLFVSYEVMVSKKNWGDALKGSYEIFNLHKIETFLVWTFTYYFAIYASTFFLILLFVLGGILVIIYSLFLSNELFFAALFVVIFVLTMLAASILVKTAINAVLFHIYKGVWKE